jgi:hypothetical protein
MRKRSPGPSRNGALVSFGTRAGAITGIGATATTGGGDRDPEAGTTRDRALGTTRDPALGTTRDPEAGTTRDPGSPTPGKGNPAPSAELGASRHVRLAADVLQSARLDPERGVDLVNQGDTARIGVGLGDVVIVHHVCVADPAL